MKHRIRKIVWLILIIGGIIASVAWYSHRSNGSSVSYQTAKVERGNLLATISATGTVEPEEVVDVGAQVTGKIKTIGLGNDGNEIDYGSIVKKGMVLAQIDDSLYAAELASTEAQLQQAQAEESKSRADLEQLQAKLYQAQRDWDRAQKLGPSEALAQTSYDSYQSAYEVAKANVTVGQASIIQAQASIASAKATLDKAQRNMGYCQIISPVDGIIIDRRVNTGQTVVSSMSTSSLFLIAKDLKRMQVWVSVNEVDIGKIYEGQPVTFTADAFAGRVFKGQVSCIRLNASMTQNVVSYVVEVNADNSDGTLLPYLTANVNFELQRRDNVLTVPNAALRWVPTKEQVSPEQLDSEVVKRVLGATAAMMGPPGGGPGMSMPTRASRTETTSDIGVVWVRNGTYVQPVEVHIGVSDGTKTEISGQGVEQDQAVVVGEQTASTESSTGTTTNPFTPQFRRR
jgi:HlyD family secretion protein